MYIRVEENGAQTIIVAYVDDMVIVQEGNIELQEVAAPIADHVSLTV